jgi:endonuclease YncB( thermonuclease family)
VRGDRPTRRHRYPFRDGRRGTRSPSLWSGKTRASWMRRRFVTNLALPAALLALLAIVAGIDRAGPGASPRGEVLPGSAENPGLGPRRLPNADVQREDGVGGDSFTCTVVDVTDGDTWRCAEIGADGRQIRVRLSGVAAREHDGTCSPGHPCPDASAEAATEELQRLVGGNRLNCSAVGITYGRVAAFCRRPDGVDLSCALLESGTVARWDRYWGAHRC